MLNSHNNKPSGQRISMNYIRLLFRDRNTLMMYPSLFHVLDKLLEREINAVRGQLFENLGINRNFEKTLPDPEGERILIQDKLYVSEETTSQTNVVGHLLGPEGTTAKYLQECFGVSIMIRGRGSLRDRRHEEANAGKPSWEHLNENLHILICAEDTENRVHLRMKAAIDCVKKFISIHPIDDRIKQMQLMEFASNRECVNYQCMAKCIVTTMGQQALLSPYASQPAFGGAPPSFVPHPLPPSSSGACCSGGGANCCFSMEPLEKARFDAHSFDTQATDAISTGSLSTEAPAFCPIGLQTPHGVLDYTAHQPAAIPSPQTHAWSPYKPFEQADPMGFSLGALNGKFSSMRLGMSEQTPFLRGATESLFMVGPSPFASAAAYSPSHCESVRHETHSSATSNGARRRRHTRCMKQSKHAAAAGHCARNTASCGKPDANA